ncbi:MAG: dihydroxyacetone kinase subunit DhaL [Chloroflexota bacterium]
MITKDDFLAWLEKLKEVYVENKAYLTELDSAIGDADHGINLSRGFTKVNEKVAGADKPIGAICKDAGMALVSSVGGASGPLYGTFFMRAGMAVGDQETLDGPALVAFFEAGLDGILQRGKAQLEDKTMVDAMKPAVDALKAAVEAGQSIHEALVAAAAAAEEGMKATIPLQARKGRASYLGERSIGHQDPGATSTHMLFKTASETWN